MKKLTLFPLYPFLILYIVIRPIFLTKGKKKPALKSNGQIFLGCNAKKLLFTLNLVWA